MISMGVTPDDHIFMARNPILMDINTDRLATYTVAVEDKTVFTGNGQGSFTVNVAEVLCAYFTDSPKWVKSNKAWMLTLENEESVRKKGQIEASDGVYGIGRYITVYNGGVSKRLFSSLLKKNESIFTAKLQNLHANFFWTVRSSDWRIVMKETELAPLAFISPIGHTLYVKERVTGKMETVVFSTDIIAAVDFAELRWHFFTTYGILANVFDVLVDNKFSCQVVIEQAQATWERYTLRWRNSFGVYECMEVTGKATMAPFSEEEETETFQEYDAYQDSYSMRRDRLKRQNTISLSTGMIRPQMVNAFVDLLQSDEVYLCGLYEEDVRVIPSTSELNIPLKVLEPMEFEVTLSFADSETLAFENASSDGFSRGGLFSPEFSGEFD